jgi:hypothetical protein
MTNDRCATLLAILAFCAPVGAQQQARFFFDISGNAGSDAAAHPGSEALSYTNPTLPAGGGRLYIYTEFLHDEVSIIHANYDITVDGGSITEAWNYNGPGQDTLTGDRRWTEALPNPATNPGGNSITFRSINVFNLGLDNDVYHDFFDIQHDNSRNFGDTLLGYVDVEGDPGATVWMTVSEQLIGYANQGPSARVYFGFGDDPVLPWEPGVRTQLPEATIVPEPVACLLLLLGGLLIARRR